MGNLRITLGVGLLSLGITGCFFKSNKAEEPVAAENEAAAESNTDSNLAKPDEADQTSASTPNENPADSVAQAKEAAPPSAPSTESSTPQTRRVVYIHEKECPVFSTQDTSSQTVGKYLQGDHLVVEMQEPWAILSTGHYLEVGCLSTKIVPRPKSENPWRSL